MKRDWEIISLLASELGYPMHYENNQQIWDEMRELCPLFYGVTREKMGDMGHVQWPCPTLDHPGTPWLYKDNRFDTPSGKGSCSPPHGARRRSARMTSGRWCSAPCGKSGIIPAAR